MKIHLTSYGSGIPLVFFHGWGFDGQIWQSLVPYFIDSYQVFLVDLPGFGLTPMQEWNDFKENLLASLPEQFIVAGWSMGGLFATRLAIEEQNRIIKLINIASSPRFISDTEWPGVPREVFVAFYENLVRDISKTLQEFIQLQVNKKTLQLPAFSMPSKEGLDSGLRILDDWDLRRDLAELKIPTCFMFGRLDPITPVKTMNFMQSVYPDFKYVLFSKAAHMPFLSHTELFVDEFLEFIQ
ncbi:alpha/beta fold hydrolase [uncultured Legionella sp.]|uniref:alpha/beta fold hydrolase n=1 Tax=uncultured Legionella sp. TaxID=210934 RepID=UPI00262D250B|nr:alpha/beta fold hydrolase [uncultured Legionella sp.]